VEEIARKGRESGRKRQENGVEGDISNAGNKAKSDGEKEAFAIGEQS
jgi:hypothetical protein